ncbi:MAG: DUF1015 domain-containing protein [Lachnospiraceae bacterium]|nr:DUF1015 domain-containing protein [Lachnospiraceae bacterium]
MNKIIEQKLNEVGLKVPNILLPKKGSDLTKFSCIAADQYTQDVNYWERVKNFIGDVYSTYNLIYPEAYMEQELANNKDNFDKVLQNKITSINQNMKAYINDGVYEDIGESFIYVERMTSSGIRKGLVVAIDLEKYDYNKGAKSLMRATELTVKERLVVRKKIRENATLDIPHILVLIDDKNNSLFDIIKTKKDNAELEKVYDFDLMENGGHIFGYKISDDKTIESIADVLINLKKNSNDGLLYAVGDGNHSLAAAKDVYEATGKCRYALVELVNIHDKGLKFYPIHRLIMGVDEKEFTDATGINPKSPLPLQDMQELLDKFGFKIDYIHGKDECIELASKGKNVAIVYDEFSHETLFDDVVKHGSLCRKSFSIGEAQDKRFYLEAQKIY